jgi:hypothetical protein
MAMHLRKQERQKGFYKRQLHRKQVVADELRADINEAKQKLVQKEQVTKKAERQLHIDQCDLERQKKHLDFDMAQQLGKMTTLLSNVRYMRDAGAAKLAAAAKARAHDGVISAARTQVTICF